MKKLEFSELGNLYSWEREVFHFLKELDLENISNIKVLPRGIGKEIYTLFIFEDKANHGVQFYYKNNQFLHDITIWKDGQELGYIMLIEDEKDEKRKKCINTIWNQFIDYFNLRIRLMFINETTPWKWNTEFTY